MFAAKFLLLIPVLAGTVSAAASSCTVRENDPYEPIPRHFDFPANPERLQSYVDTDNVHRLRSHAWLVFAGLTHPSRHFRGLPVWETWYDAADVFSDPSKPVTHMEPLRSLSIPVELRPDLAPGQRPTPGKLGAFMVYNRETCDAIRKNSLYSKTVLNDLQKKPPRDVAQVGKGFSPASVALKTSWMILRKDTVCSKIPVWNFAAFAPASLNTSSDNWPDPIWIRPSPGLCPEERNVRTLEWAQRHFYWFKVPSDSDGLARVQNTVEGNPQAGDYLVLVGFHFATKELPNWVWATFWWHDHPDQGVYADDRPGPGILKGVWRNYLMNVAYDMDKPREPDGRPHIAYNPYLEGGLIGGLESNCMTCHRRATWPVPADVQTASPWTPPTRQFPQLVVRGREAATATYFNEPGFGCLLKLGFLWSLAHLDNPSPPSPAAACSPSEK
jgi:hypothetical protein